MSSIQQSLLDIISSCLSQTLSDPDFSSKLQLIKHYFYHRHYSLIFTQNQDLLKVYSAEFLPHRSLAYLDLLSRLSLHHPFTLDHVLCLGAGNCAEFLALASLRASFVHSVDQSNYHLLPLLQPFFPSTRSCFSEINLLSSDASSSLDFSKATLVTACFLLNELYQASKSGFAKFIQHLISQLPLNSFFLCIDSAGSFSQQSVGSSEFMIYRFLDHLKDFECVYSQDAQWFRCPKSLQYPLPLQNMRYFCRLYRKI